MGAAGGRASRVGHRSKNIGKVTGLDITKKIITEARLPVGALIMSDRMDGKNDAVSSSVRFGIARKAREAHPTKRPQDEPPGAVLLVCATPINPPRLLGRTAVEAGAPPRRRSASIVLARDHPNGGGRWLSKCRRPSRLQPG